MWGESKSGNETSNQIRLESRSAPAVTTYSGRWKDHKISLAAT